MLIAQLTDLHIRPRGRACHRVSESNMLAARAVEALRAAARRPDVVLVTGDVVDQWLAEEYDVAAALLRRSPAPTLAVPGNHDDRALFRARLGFLRGVTEDPDFVQFVVEDQPLRLIGLDTVVPGESRGGLCARRLAFLEATLAAAPERPTLIFLHHPPFLCGVPSMDAIRLIEGAEPLADILSRNRQVARLVCGHHHRAIEGLWGGVPVSAAPATCHQARLDFDPDASPALVLEPPAYRLHLWQGPRDGLVSHTVYVETYPGPFPFGAED